MRNASRFVILIVVMATVLVSIATAGFAQLSQFGTIVGRVMDPDGSPLPGVQVELDSPALMQERTVTTGPDGQYRVSQLPVGAYQVTFRLQGFATLVRQDVPVEAGQSWRLNATLELAGVEEVVTVSGSAPVVDIKSAAPSVNLSEGVLEDLPTSRDINSLLQNQAPSVVNNREDVGGNESGLNAIFSTAGSPFHQNTFTYNGINVTGLNFPGTSDLYFDFETFEEVEISTAAHRAEIPTPGVYINVIAQRATNTWNGQIETYYSGENLQSENLTSSLRDAGISRGVGIDSNFSFAAQLGGPIIEDKLRLYANYRYDNIKRFVVGFPETEDTIIWAPAVTANWQINDTNTLHATFTYNKYDKPRRGASPLVSVEATGVEDNHNTVFGTQWQSALSEDTFLDIRFGYNGQPFQIFLQEGVTSPATVELSTGELTGARETGFQNKHARVQLAGSLSHYEDDWLGGGHDLKIGYDFARGPNQNRSFAFRDLNLATLNGEPFSVTQYNTPALTRELHHFYSGYAQDDYNVGNTMLSVGVRFDGYSGKIRETEKPAGTFSAAKTFPEQEGPTFANVAPRLAIIHDVFGDGSLALKASASRYYHHVGPHWFNAIAQAGLGGNTFRWNDLNDDGQFDAGEEGPLLGSFGGSITSLDPDVDRAYTDELTVGLDAELASNFGVSARFIYRRERDLLGIGNEGVPFSAYSPVTALDPGEDGIPGTNDDATIQVFNQDPTTIDQDSLLITNPEGFETSFRGLELKAEKRFADGWYWLGSLAMADQDISQLSVVGVSSAFLDQERSGLSGGSSPFLSPNFLINNDGGPGFYERSYMFKTSVIASLPGGITASGVFKAQAGTPFNRVVTLSSDIDGNPLNQGSITINAEPRGSREYSDVVFGDVHLSKRFEAGRANFEAVLDVFNVANANTVTTVNGNTATFGAPLDILGPRVVRLGARVSF